MNFTIISTLDYLDLWKTRRSRKRIYLWIACERVESFTLQRRRHPLAQPNHGNTDPYANRLLRVRRVRSMLFSASRLAGGHGMPVAGSPSRDAPPRRTLPIKIPDKRHFLRCNAPRRRRRASWCRRRRRRRFLVGDRPGPGRAYNVRKKGARCPARPWPAMIPGTGAARQSYSPTGRNGPPLAALCMADPAAVQSHTGETAFGLWLALVSLDSDSPSWWTPSPSDSDSTSNRREQTFGRSIISWWLLWVGTSADRSKSS